MQWFYNMKIAKKLILSFCLMAFVAAFIGWVGYTGIVEIKKNEETMYNDRLIPVVDLGNAHINFLMMRVNMVRMMVTKDPKEREKCFNTVETKQAIVEQLMEKNSKTQITPEAKEQLDKYKETWAYYLDVKSRIAASLKQQDEAGAVFLTNGELGVAGRNNDEVLDKLIAINASVAEQLNADIKKKAESTLRNMIIILSFGVLFAFLMGLFIARIIGKPINTLVTAADKLALGDVNVKVVATSMDEVGDLTRSIEKMVENIKDNAKVAEEMAKGNLTVEIEAKSANDVLAKSMQQVVETLKNLVGEAQMLTQSSLEGKLNVRGNADKFNGGYRDIIKGVNNTLNAVTGPMKMAAEYIDRISKGDIPPKVTDIYNGDFNKIKDNLNQCIDSLNLLAENLNDTIVQSRAGEIDLKVKDAGLAGKYGALANGINDMLDAVNTPTGEMLDILNQYAQGDLSRTMRDLPGKQIFMTKTINTLRANVLALVADANLLSKSAVEGKLDARADASKHQGDYRKIIQGVNDTLDAVIGPLNVAAEYVDRISKGNIPPKIMDSYQGDFNEIKNNLNACIDGLGGLVEANAVLQKMDNNDYTVAVKGQYQGVFADVASAVNGVQERVKHVIESVTKISKGDLSDLEAYRAIGNGRGRRSDNDELVPSMIKMMENLKTTITDIEMLSRNSLDGKLDARADVSKHQGDYRKIVQGVNDTLDAVIGPLNVAAEYVDRMSKGDIPPKITDTYNGDFNEIKNNLNACIDGLGGLVEANAVLQKMDNNDYTVAVKGQYQGVFAEVASAVNGVQERIKHIIGSVTKVSKGDLSDLETYRAIGNGRGRRSDNDELVPSMIKMMDNLRALVTDAEMLSQAAVDGRLATRADASKHEGDFRKIVEGVNDTLDAVIEPVNEAVGCIEKMAKGDLSVQVSGDYNGDLAKMKNALNATLEALNDILGQVNTAADQVVSGSQQVSDAAQSLSQGATEQASSLEEITASMTEMNSQTKQNAENAQQANRLPVTTPRPGTIGCVKCWEP